MSSLGRLSVRRTAGGLMLLIYPMATGHTVSTFKRGQHSEPRCPRQSGSIGNLKEGNSLQARKGISAIVIRRKRPFISALALFTRRTSAALRLFKFMSFILGNSQGSESLVLLPDGWDLSIADSTSGFP